MEGKGCVPGDGALRTPCHSSVITNLRGRWFGEKILLLIDHLASYHVPT